MRTTSPRRRPASFVPTVLALLLSLTSIALAQENGELGRLWTFEDPPLAHLEQRHGFAPDPAWLDALRLGTLRLGDEDQDDVFGSASFVSPRGLIVTSTRCVRDAVTITRPRDLEIINDGFVAASPEQEIRLKSGYGEWLTAAQLVRTSDVTDEINAGIRPDDDAVRTASKRDANRTAILDAARLADPMLVPEIVSLHRGAVVRLYQYRVYDDVRLVVLPHVQTAHFGGDPDNLTYPRYVIDFAFLRAYEDGRPADTTAHHLTWKPGGAAKDELVFVSGSPGPTKRWLTKARMELERDFWIPMRIEQVTNELRISKDPGGNTYAGDFDPENPSRHWAWFRTGILEAEQKLKAANGNLRGLESATLMAQKTAAEQAFKDRVMADPQLAERYGDLWDRIDDVMRERRVHDVRARFQTADGSPVFGVVVAIVRACDPDETEARRRQARKTVESWAGADIRPNFYFTAHCMDHLERARTWLPEDDPFFVNVLGNRSAEGFYELIEGKEAQASPNWLGYPGPRQALLEAGWPAILESDDPAVVAARELVVIMRENERRGERLDATERALGEELARAVRACYGPTVASDGTGTPRFTDGVVRGFPCNGTIAPHRTTFYGLYARHAAFDGAYPFNLPRIWLDRRDRVDLAKTVNFVSTNDVTVESAGSVVVNEALEVVGVVVDGNIESLHNDFVFRDDVPRAVSTHVDGIMESLVKIYDARHIAEELTGRPAAGDVEAMLAHLQPDIMVVEGDPVETTTLDELMRVHHVPGVSIAVIRDGAIDWTRGFGVADVETGRAVTPRTLFQAASISVPVTAAAALTMVRDGLLDLDEDVNLELKSWTLPASEHTDRQPVTLRHLLSHTAATNVLGLPGYARDATVPSTIDVLDGRGNTGPVRVVGAPGANWQYSDGGYVIVGQLMEDVTGQPFAEIIRERVFEPAGMTNSTYVLPLPPAREANAATGHGRDGLPIEGRHRHYPEIGAAGLWTTAEDLARFVLAIQRSRAGAPGGLLSSELADEMLTPVMDRYGLGLWLSDDGERLGHGGTNRGFRIRGANRGFRTRLSASIDDGWGIVVLTNGDGGSAICELVPIAASKAYGWSEDVLLDAYGTYGPIRRPRVDIGEAALARLAGTYEVLPEWAHARSRVALFPNMGTVELKVENGRLVAHVPRSAGTKERMEFLPQSEVRAMQRRTGLLMDFIVEDGEVAGFVFREVEARRVD